MDNVYPILMFIPDYRSWIWWYIVKKTLLLIWPFGDQSWAHLMIYSDQDLSSFLLLYLTSWPDWWGVSPTSYISMNGVGWDGHLEMKLTHNNCFSSGNCVPFKWHLLRFVPLSLSFRCYRISTKDIIFSAKSAPETNLCLSLYCIVFVIVIFVVIVFEFILCLLQHSSTRVDILHCFVSSAIASKLVLLSKYLFMVDTFSFPLFPFQ